METKGVGARIAWSIESKRVLTELAEILGGHDLQLLDYEEGEVRRKALLADYAVARDNGSLAAKSFGDAASFKRAVDQTLAQGSSNDLFDMLLQDSERKGVYRFAREDLAEYATRLLSYDGSSILAATLDGRHGVLLDVDDAGGGLVTFELESW